MDIDGSTLLHKEVKVEEKLIPKIDAKKNWKYFLYGKE
jgi:hypothetical protein